MYSPTRWRDCCKAVDVECNACSPSSKHMILGLQLRPTSAGSRTSPSSMRACCDATCSDDRLWAKLCAIWTANPFIPQPRVTVASGEHTMARNDRPGFMWLTRMMCIDDQRSLAFKSVLTDRSTYDASTAPPIWLTGDEDDASEMPNNTCTVLRCTARDTVVSAPTA